MQWVQICAVTSSVAEACSSAAVLLLRLQLYLCFSHHRNCDASTLKPARYSSVQAALGSLVQAGSPCRSCCPSAAWKQSQPAAAQAGFVRGVQVRKFLSLGSLFCMHVQTCRGDSILGNTSLNLFLWSCSLCQPRCAEAMQ